MTQIKRVRPKPRTNEPMPGFTLHYHQFEQCQMPLTRMSPSSLGPDQGRWRAERSRYRKAGFDANYCFLDAHVEIDGKVYCTKHAGQIALAILLGEGNPNE